MVVIEHLAVVYVTIPFILVSMVSYDRSIKDFTSIETLDVLHLIGNIVL